MPIVGVLVLLLVVAAASRRSGGRAVSEPPECSEQFNAHLLDGRRRIMPPTLIVLHSTEGDSAKSAAEWFQNPSSQGSAHVVVGEDGCFRTVPDSEDAAGAGHVNPYALHIEFAGFARWSRSQWLSRQRTLALGIAQVWAWSQMYGIPLRLLSRAELQSGKPGVTTHADVSAVFGGTHTDPGPGFPVDVILSGQV